MILRRLIDQMKNDDHIKVINEDGETLLRAAVGDNVVTQRMAILGASEVYNIYDPDDVDPDKVTLIIVGNN